MKSRNIKSGKGRLKGDVIVKGFNIAKRNAAKEEIICGGLGISGKVQCGTIK